MTPQDKAEQAKIAFYDAACAILEHLNDPEPLWELENKLQIAMYNYWEALNDLTYGLPPETDPRYAHAIKSLGASLTGHVSFLKEVTTEYRKRQQLPE